ncbi:hypothetical protein BHU72_12800 [Desulfuribacillus stibiiarsenatis]|uniref:DUF554 domain-containing protein n=1 Tax=Desulfuribacillus stibiiarsenatis TaxID=1390249 RepID=A0A1E5L8K3_9FIRM|nr:DUF554 domain-containing protein [Desulfuribacillus stibiiarsenatis]OEH86487.1 hypothetical protein BHU72_12800 [Desulfuribacillus stibiiarsenatis]
MELFSVLQGTFVNGGAIILGALIGIVLPKIPDQYKTTVLQAIGLSVIVIGIGMAMGTQNALIMIMSAVIGGIIGELLRLEDRIDQLGVRVEKIFAKRSNGISDGKIAKGFVFATLIYCVGSMAIVGALDSGLDLNHDVLYTKSMLDGFSSIIFASTMGIGVMLSAFSVLIYQGIIALLASSLTDVLNDSVVNEIRAVGGLLIMSIGLNLLEVIKIRVGNLLPSIFVAVIIMIILEMLGIII